MKTCVAAPIMLGAIGLFGPWDLPVLAAPDVLPVMQDAGHAEETVRKSTDVARQHDLPPADRNAENFELVSGDNGNPLRAEAARKAGGKNADGVTHEILTFAQPPTEADRAALEKAGVRLIAKLDRRRYLAATGTPERDGQQRNAIEASLTGRREVAPDEKLHRDLMGNRRPAWSLFETDEQGRERHAVLVVFHDDVDRVRSRDLLNAHNATLLAPLQSLHAYLVSIDLGIAPAMAALDEVSWIEPPLPEMGEVNDLNRAVTDVEPLHEAPYGLSGAGLSVMVYDGGAVLVEHPDFDGRVRSHDPVPGVAHATHVTGTIIGSGLASGGTLRGMAPQALAESFAVENLGGNPAEILFLNPGDLESDYLTAFDSLDTVVSNNSIGSNVCSNGSNCTWNGRYGVTSAVVDSLVSSHQPPMRVVFAAGNERSCDRCRVEGAIRADGYGSLAPPANMKNAIIVGATNGDTGDVSAFSSWGPTGDGRIKPDVVAPGCQLSDDFGVTSLTALGDYDSLCGTSMAAPTVSGINLLLLEAYERTYGPIEQVSNALLKSLLIHTAEDISQPGPDYRSGYGLVQARAAVESLINGAFRQEQIVSNGTRSYWINVPADTQDMRVTLTWDDRPGTPLASRALVHDLDLHLYDPASTRHFPWTLDPSEPDAPARRVGEDHLNNVEVVDVRRPQQGLWRVDVRAGFLLGGTQPFSIVAFPGFSTDCDGNGVADLDEIAADPSLDCASDGLLDRCEPDCNRNGSADSCDVVNGQATDCDRNGVLDLCDSGEDCNGNSVHDACEVLDGLLPDCDGDLRPDLCEDDCDGDGQPDVCAILEGADDCDANGIPDSCQSLSDCNNDGTSDACEVAAGALDANSNGVPDYCESGQFINHVSPVECVQPFRDGSPDLPYCTIQEAIDHSLSGDVIELAPGVYNGDGNRNIDFAGRLIHLRSTDPSDPSVVAATVIDCEFVARGFSFVSGETEEAILDGITITRGLTAVGSTPNAYFGGAVYIDSSSPTIRNCRFIGNIVEPIFFYIVGGGAVFVNGGEPTIEQCEFRENMTMTFGGALYFSEGARGHVIDCLFEENSAFFGAAISLGIGSDVQIDRCRFIRNETIGDGGGAAVVAWGAAQGQITSSLFTGNRAGGNGGVVNIAESSVLRFSGCTLIENESEGGSTCFSATGGKLEFDSSIIRNSDTPAEFAGVLSSTFVVDHCNVRGGNDAVELATGSTLDWGRGNIDADPLFVNPAGGDYALLQDSPCANGGRPGPGIPGTTDLLLNNRVQQCRIDMGAVESPWFGDCNDNGQSDACDVSTGAQVDCDGNAVPDQCEDTTEDCNENDIWDACDIAEGSESDCNENLVPDACELTDGLELDCDENGTLDSCEIESGDTPDVNGNGIPDVCEVCETNEACSDGIYCNGEERCANSVCVTGLNPCPGRVCDEASENCFECLTSPDCDDNSPCTVDLCDHGTCIYNNLEGPCNDGQMCTTGDTCQDGRCVGAIIDGCGIQFSLRVAAVDGERLPEPVSSITVYNPQTITIELFVRSWGPEELQLYNVAIDGETYTSGPVGSLSPIRIPNPTAGAFINQSREDFLFHGLDIIAGVFNGDTTQYEYGGFVLLPEDCVADKGNDAYLGTLILEASAAASGPFSICYNGTDADEDLRPDFTFGLDCVEENIIPVDLKCADILVVADCNGNGISDEIDIADGTSEDCTANGFPDECEPDCNINGAADSCDLASQVSVDCNGNDRPDECDIASGESADCNRDGRPDECEADCNGNGMADTCDIASGTSIDCDGQGIPDECEDCNDNGIGDICEIEAGQLLDCNGNQVPDHCDLENEFSTDCDTNGVPDECQQTPEDCNGNDVWDRCDVFFQTSPDCNGNFIPDACDISSGFSRDCDDNQLPDECADIFPPLSQAESLDGVRGFVVHGFSPAARFGFSAHAAGDFNADGVDDYIVGSPGYTPNDRTELGAAFVIFGERGTYGPEMQVSNRSLTAFGNEVGDNFGHGVTGDGDFNGDGISDVAIGVPGWDMEDAPNTGAAHIIFGNPEFRGGDLIVPEMLDGTNGFTIRGAADRTFSGRRVEFAGDVNGDGLDDLLISAHTADDNGSDSTGRTFLLFGTTTPPNAEFHLAQLEPELGGDGSLGCYFAGINEFDQSGFAMSKAGDVNDDGFDDFLIGAHPADPNENQFAGETYLVFGGTDVCGNGRVQLADLDGINGVRFTGRGTADLSGHHVSDTGDLNADGFDDFAVSAIWADPSDASEAGEVYIIWGHDGTWPAVFPFESLAVESGGNGETGVIIEGIDNGHLTGFGLGGGGDIDADGISDLIIGAYAADEGETLPNIGRMYGLRGRDVAWPATLPLTELLREDIDPEDRIGFTFKGHIPNSFFGYVVGPLGDINGDGATDIMATAPGPTESDPPAPGQTYVIFGRHRLFVDCNVNGTPDHCDLLDGVSTDCNDNQRLDDCEGDYPDCDGNGRWDLCDFQSGAAFDCNDNGIPDKCDLLDGTEDDCNDNSIPDSCESTGVFDCNANGTWDRCDAQSGFSEDCNANLIPDECEPGGQSDCNTNGVSDLCEVFRGLAQDQNVNGVLDSCEPLEVILVSADGSPIFGQPVDAGEPFDNIRDAIAAAGTGEDRVIEIRVAPGVYTGERNRDIRFNEGLGEGQTRSILLRCLGPIGSCVIDATGIGHGIIFDAGESAGTKVQGFAILNTFRGGIECVDSSPVIEDCVVTQNFKGGPGAGIYCDNASPIVRRCVVTGNYVGGIACENGSAPRFENCLIADNHGANGGGISATGASHPRIFQCTIAGNTAQWTDGGISTHGANTGVVSGSIIHGNTPPGGAGTSSVVFSNVQDFDHGLFNIDEPAGFVGTFSGQWSSVNEPTENPQHFRMTDLDAEFIPGELVGAIANVATQSQVQLGYPIVANSEKSITILSSGYFLAEVHGTYRISDYRLQQDSPCINTGALTKPAGMGTTDLRGQQRVSACRMDMGALESTFSVDCDGNGEVDACEALLDGFADCNENRVPDVCEDDCDQNAIADPCEIRHDVRLDINGNGRLDRCEFTACDLDANGVIEEIDRDLMRDCLLGIEPRSGDCPDIDLNGDGTINDKDMDVFAECYNTFRPRYGNGRLSSN